MNAHATLIDAIKSRGDDRAAINTADWYVRKAISECGEGLFSKTFGTSSDQLLSKAAQQLVFSHPDCTTYKQSTSAAEFKELLPADAEIPKHTALLDFHTLTTPQEDRDKDVLKTEGAEVDPELPILWQHLQTVPIGKMVAIIEHSKKALKMVSALLDINEFTSDVIKLVEAKVLRWSHGFRALEWEERKANDPSKGFEVTSFEIMEASKVSVPSNTAARTELFTMLGRGKLASDYWKTVAKHYGDQRPAQMAVSGTVQMKLRLGDYEQEVSALTIDDAVTGMKAMSAIDSSSTSSTGGISTATVSTPDYSDPNWDKPATFKTIKGCKNFEPEMEHLEASKLEYDWAAKFLGCQIKDLQVTGTFVSNIRAGSYFYAGEETQRNEKWEKRDQRNLTRDGKEEPLNHEVIELNSERSQTFMIRGMEFWKIPADKKLVIKHRKTWGGYDVVIYAKDESGNQYMEKCWEWVRQNNFLKGEAFSLTGKFIKRKGQDLDDLFLESKNREAVARAIRLVNDKGEAMKSRGQVYMGPPGTGKTMSARVLLNNAKCSFIWVTARDFWQTGAVSGICHALDLAAELSPSIVCFEDVDNWIRGSSTDLLKTEMDGLDQKGGVLTILTTNYPEQFPDALLDRPGRFHDICEFHLPTEKIRLQMLQRWTVTERQVNDEVGEMITEKLHVAEADLEKIAKQTDGYSGAHMYELCEFAKTLKDDDNLDMNIALTKSLEKIEEQRSLINQSQLAGSHYKPSRSETLESHKQLCDRYEEKHERGDMLTLKEFIDELAVKGGRVISARHLATLKAVHSDLEEMAKMDKMPRAGQAICESCITKLGGVIKAADKPVEDDDGKPKPDEEKPKTAVLNGIYLAHGPPEEKPTVIKREGTDLAIWPSGDLYEYCLTHHGSQPKDAPFKSCAKIAAEILLGSDDDALLKQVHDTIATLLEIAEQNEKAREYRDSAAYQELIET